VQFCGQCGVQNTISAVFCRACGSKLVLTAGSPSAGIAQAPVRPATPVSPKAAPTQAPVIPQSAAKPVPSPAAPKPVAPPKPKVEKPKRPPMTAKTKAILGISVTAALVATLVGVFVVPRPVAVQIEVLSKTGGVFNEDCSLTADGHIVLSDKIQAVPLGSTPTEGSGATISFSPSGSNCLGSAIVLAQPNADYDLYVGANSAGRILASNVDSGIASVSVSVAVLRTLTGTVTISDKYDSCTGTPTKFDCSWSYTSVDNFSVEVNQSDKTCNGRTGFAGVKASSAINVQAMGSKTKLKGKLSTGTYKLTSLKSGEISCTFTFEIANVPYDSSGYELSVPGHNATRFTMKSVIDASWKANLVFKN